MTEREAFEQWYRKYHGHLVESRTGDRYDYSVVQRAWDAWQAALGYAREQGDPTLADAYQRGREDMRERVLTAINSEP